MKPYEDYDGPLGRWAERVASNLVERRAEEFAKRYAVKEDGTEDEKLGNLIRYEVYRRGFMSRELDIYEPARWAGISFLLSSAGGTALRALMGEKHILKLAATGAASGLLGMGISLLRPYLRFDAALYGGAQTALGMYQSQYGVLDSSDGRVDPIVTNHRETLIQKAASYVERERENADQGSKDIER